MYARSPYRWSRQRPIPRYWRTMLIAKTLKLTNSDTKIAMTKPGIGAAPGSVADVTRAIPMTSLGTLPPMHPKT